MEDRADERFSTFHATIPIFFLG